MKFRTALIALVVGLAISALAADTRSSATGDANAAFARLKSLVGQWEADTNMGKVQITYELTSGDHVLLEHMKVPSLKEDMVTTYYLDGGKLVLTHYCQLGNQPRMVARRIDLGSGEIAFDFAGAGNLSSPHAEHMHSATIRLVDDNHFNNAWTLFQNSKPKLTVTGQYARVQ